MTNDRYGEWLLRLRGGVRRPVTAATERRSWRRRSLPARVLVAMTVMLLSVFCAPQVDASDGSISEPTPEPTIAPTATLEQQAVAPQLSRVEPLGFSAAAGATLSISGHGFITTTVARLVGYGLLDTVFVNEGWLKAQVPAGIAPARYELEVFNGALISNRLAVEATAPSPTPTPPAPPSTPPPGRPILTVRNFSVEPTKVRAGQEFAVTIEIYNNGSRAGENTMAVFTGGSFVPVGENGHMIWQLHINHTAVVTQRMRAPDTLSAGIHQLSVDLSANDFAGDHYDYPTTIPVEVISTPSTAAPPPGRPRIIVERATTSPTELVPGDPFTLTLRLANRGNATAQNLFVTSASTDLAIPAGGGDTVAIDRIAVGGTVTVTLPLVLEVVEKGGRHTLNLALSYGDATGGIHTDQQAVGVDISATLTARPQLLIRAYRTAPAALLPGEPFTLTVEMANVGGGDAYQVTLSLGGKQGEALDPFISPGAGNVLFIRKVAPGTTATLYQPLIVDGSATAKAYNLPVDVAWADSRGARQSEVQRMSLVVRYRVDLAPRFYQEPGLLRVGDAASLELELGNLGRSAVNLSSLSASSPQMDVRVSGTPFSGSLDAGGVAPLDLAVTPRQAGAVSLVVAATYRDDFYQTQVLTWTLPLQVEEAPTFMTPDDVTGAIDGDVPPQNEPVSMWSRVLRFFRGFLGMGS
ncbi:MAG: hypothetical protein ACP5HS_09985 [Anaerolineae bacterium]